MAFVSPHKTTQGRVLQTAYLGLYSASLGLFLHSPVMAVGLFEFFCEEFEDLIRNKNTAFIAQMDSVFDIKIFDRAVTAHN